MPDRWTDAQVLALAPDPSSGAAGRRLAVPGPWAATGCGEMPQNPGPGAVWGECIGSGQAAYRTVVDLTARAFSCSCPSRKFPCKHAIGLLLLWSAGTVPDAAEPPDWVAAWIADRRHRQARGPARRSDDAASDAPGEDVAASADVAAADPRAARVRAERREQRMLDGLAELDQWLRDQVRSGLAGTHLAGYRPFDALAARMVDAQLPAVAATVRQLAARAVGEGWPGHLLEEYGLLHLLASAAPAALAERTGDVAATVREHLGVTVPREAVLSAPGERDRWRVLALRDDAEERLTVRRVWLRGESCGRLALVLSFAVAGQPLDTSLVPGTTMDALVHRYPGAVPLRAVVGTRYATSNATGGVAGLSLPQALDQWAAALAGDPWLRSWPVVIEGAVPVVDGDSWWLVDRSGSLPLTGVDAGGWLLLAASGGHPVTLLAEIVPAGVRPVQVFPAAGPAASAAS